MGTGVGEAMLIGAVTGAGTSAVTGGDPLKGALLGAAGGGLGAGIAGATTGATTGAATGTTTGTAAGATTGTAAGTTSGAAGGAELANLASLGDTGVATQTLGSSGLESLAQTPSAIMDPGLNSSMMGDGGVPTVTNTNFRPGTTTSAETPMFPSINKLATSSPIAYPAGSAALANLLAYKSPGSEEEKKDEYRGALSDFSYSRSGYTPYRAASGGLMDTAVARRMTRGGHLGSYSDGGQLLKGREADSNGMKDDIPASIEGAQPALLADGEFVIPADVVSGLGNGSTEAGARELYEMMEKVRAARTGRSKQAPEIDADKMMPA